MEIKWRKSKCSIANGSCVEISPSILGVLVRDSKETTNPYYTILAFDKDAWGKFITQVKK